MDKIEVSINGFKMEIGRQDLLNLLAWRVGKMIYEKPMTKAKKAKKHKKHFTKNKKGKRCKRYTKADLFQIWGLYNEKGWKVPKIARFVGRSRLAIYMLIKRMKANQIEKMTIKEAIK